jgi:hypothetical protein
LFRDEDPSFVAVRLEADASSVEEGTDEGNQDAAEDGTNDANFPLRYSLVTDRNVTADYNTSRTVQLKALVKEFLPSAIETMQNQCKFENSMFGAQKATSVIHLPAFFII